MAIFHYFLRLKNIVSVCHIFFMHSSVKGHLVCFHVLAIVNSAVMNLRVHGTLWIMVFLGICPGVGLLDHIATLFLVFLWTFILFSIVTTPIHIPTNSVGGLPFWSGMWHFTRMIKPKKESCWNFFKSSISTTSSLSIPLLMDI